MLEIDDDLPITGTNLTAAAVLCVGVASILSLSLWSDRADSLKSAGLAPDSEVEVKLHTTYATELTDASFGQNSRDYRTTYLISEEEFLQHGQMLPFIE